MKSASRRLPAAARRALATLSVAAGLLLSGSAAAVGFGNIVVHSALGRPLHAEIEILRPSEEVLVDTCYRIVRERLGDSDIPQIDRGRLELRQTRDGHHWLVVTTGVAIREPLMSLALRVGCGADLVREFTLIFSPPEQLPAPPLEPPVAAGTALRSTATPGPIPATAATRRAATPGEIRTPRSLARSLYPDSRRQQRRFVDELIEANPELELVADTPLPADVVLALPAMRPSPPVALPPPPPPAPAAVPKPAAASTPAASGARPVRRPEQLQLVDRLRIGADPDPANSGSGDPLLRLSAELADAAPVTVTGAGSRRHELLRLEFRRLIDADERPWADPETPGRRDRLRQSAADFRRFAELLDQLGQPDPPVAAAVLPAPAVAPPPAALVAASAAPAVERPTGNGWLGTLLPLLAGAATVSLLLWWMAWQRRRATVVENVPQLEPGSDPADIFAGRTPVAAPALSPQPVTPVAMPAATPALALRIAAEPPSPALLPAAEQVAAPVVEPVAEPVPPPTPAVIAFELPDSASAGVTPRTLAAVVHELGLDGDGARPSGGGHEESSADIVEVADVMVSFGRVDEAIEMLDEFIGKSPRASVQAWLRLLDLYAREGRMLDFEALSQRLNQNFNVEIPSWSEATALAPPTARRQLADFPHVRSEIERSWGSAAGLHYLQKLIDDNRGGTRNGFSRVVAEEIVFLAAVLDEKLRQQADKDSILEFTP